MNPLDLLVGLRQADYADTLAEVEGKVDLILMSPPYEDARTYGAGVHWKLEDYQRLGDAVKRALRPDGGQCLCVLDGPVRDYRGDGYTERSDLPMRVLLDWKDRFGLIAPDPWVAYVREGFTGHYERGFRKALEPILWLATPGERTLNKAAIAVRRTSAENGRRRSVSTPSPGGKRRLARDQKGQTSSVLPPEWKMPSDLFDLGAVGMNKSGCVDLEAAGHPAPYPYRLASRLVLCFSNPGDLVVDPFLGSGTSLIAALDHGRRFFGGDLLARQDDGELWIDVAQRIAVDRYAQRTLFEPPTAVAPPEQMTIG